MSYHKIPNDFWYKHFLLNCSDKVKLLTIYLLTSPHRISEGLYRLPKNYICADLEWQPEELAEAFTKLLDLGFIKYDPHHKIILIPEIVAYQTPQNPNQEKSAVNKLRPLIKSSLFKEFVELNKSINSSFYKRLCKEFGESLAPAQSPARSRTQSQTQNQTQSQENKEIADFFEEYDNQNKTSEKSSAAKENTVNSNLVIFDEKNSVVKDSKAVQLTELLIDRILDNNPRAQVPEKDPNNAKFKQWTKAIERLHRLGPIGAKENDNKAYSWNEIENIINFSQDNEFWSSNILSAQKLRKQIIKLENQLKQTGKSKSSKKMDMLAELYVLNSEEA
jgi:hypothetical protein